MEALEAEPQAVATRRRGVRVGRREALGGLAAAATALAMAACGEMPAATSGGNRPSSAAALGVTITVVPGESTEPLEGAKLAIEGGKLNPTELSLNTTDATVLHVVNRDDTAYAVRISHLVDEADIAPKTTTILGFTSPDSGRYDGYLLSADGASTLGQFTVDVRASS
jgi:hypothetical protein